ncbi:MAG: hypothetical protein D6802_03460 [Ardenticatenia bacterium]|nr:MAG: hypothetical protein D6802_03460 [Ardenticatenia bacterium]
MWKRRFLVASCLVWLMGLAACGGAEPSEPVSSPTTEAPAPMPPERGLEEQPPALVIQAALEAVASVSGVSTAELQVVATKEVEWPDTSLGCPKPGEMYLQVITPGYLVRVQAPDGTEYEVHTDATGDTALLCSPNADDATRGGLDTTTELSQLTTTEFALNVVAQWLGLESREQLQVLEQEEVEWPNTALGCPRPDYAYAEVIVPGERLLVQAPDGTRYEVHLGQDGHMVVCDEAQTPLYETTLFATTDVEGNMNLSAEARPAFEAALNALQSEGFNVDALTLESWEAVTWRDSSLGCPQPDMMYAQVLTPGYRFVFSDRDGNVVYVHTDSGARAVVCEKPAENGALPNE